jgi:DNA-binding ferritin-like protein
MKSFDAEPTTAVFFEMLAQFNALAHYYREIHWTSQGQLFYQDHLLAERLYNEVSDVLDSIAEKGIGQTNERSFVLTIPHLGRVVEILQDYPHTGDASSLFAGALSFERQLGEQLDQWFQTIKSAGINDFLGQLSDEGLNRIYLLQGRLSATPGGAQAATELAVRRTLNSYR